MKKIKITAKQYDTILLNESITRLEAPESIIGETLNEDVQLLEEGWKEVVLGIAMMMGVGLTGLNKVVAQDATKNAEIMAQIKSTLEDENKLKQVVDLLKEKGMRDPEGKLSQNAEKVVDEFNKIAADDDIKYRVDVKVVNNLQALKGKLGQGYALKKADISQDTVKGSVEAPVVVVTDTIELDLGSDNLYVTGGYTLSKGGIDTITTAIQEINNLNGKIKSVYIETSTDAEIIPKFRSKEGPTGNIQLASLRTQSITNLLSTLGVTNNITHREIPNNGSNVVSTKEFLTSAKDKKQTEVLRNKTSEFRYAKIIIVATVENQEPTKGTVDVSKVISNYRFELVKVIEQVGTKNKISTKAHFKHKSFRCKKMKHHGRSVDSCATF